MQVRFKSRERPPDQLDGVKILYNKTKGKGHKIAWYLILFAVLSPILLLLTGVVGSWLTLTANGTVALEQYEVRAPRSGRISQLGVIPGETVAAGKTVVVLDSLELDAAAARNAVERQAAAGARRQQQGVSGELLLRERVLRYQQMRRDAIAALVQQGAATVAELNAAESLVTEAEAGVLQTRAAAQRAGIDTAEIDHDLIERQQRSMTLSAPYGGRVLELPAKPGQYVTPGEPLVILARTDNPRVIAYTSPKFGIRLKVGMQATIHFPDGTRTLATVSEPPRLTQRMPADLVDQFGLRPMTVVLNLQPADRLGENQKVHGLPVSVRFHYDWESSGLGKPIGALLGGLSR